MNKYFDKKFCISLFENEPRWKSVYKQFRGRGITIDRLIAVDGRCKQSDRKGCIDKLKYFEIAFNVKIPQNIMRRTFNKLKVTVPATSLTLGTLNVLRAMVNNNWKRVFICEDDINLVPNFEKKFMEGTKELDKTPWDMIYIGCGNECGTVGISEEQTSENKHQCTFCEYGECYCKHRDDLRTYCYDCKKFSNSLSIPINPGGSWAFAVSLSGAKKLIPKILVDPTQHIDQIYREMVMNGEINAFAFDPPIAYHMDIRQGRVTDIPWGN